MSFGGDTLASKYEVSFTVGRVVVEGTKKTQISRRLIVIAFFRSHGCTVEKDKDVSNL